MTPFQAIITASIVSLLLFWAFGLLYLAVSMNLYAHRCVYRQLLSRISSHVLPILLLAFSFVCGAFGSTTRSLQSTAVGSSEHAACIQSHQFRGMAVATLLSLLNAPQTASLVLLAAHFSTGLATEPDLPTSGSKTSVGNPQTYHARDKETGGHSGFLWRNSRQLLQLNMSEGKSTPTCTLHTTLTLYP